MGVGTCGPPKKEDVLVTVVIPGYNIEKSIKKSVKSILSQTHSKLEIIIVLNGCTDNSVAVCTRLKKRDSRIKVIVSDKKGSFQARRTGAFEGSGYYLLFFDSGDWFFSTDSISTMLDSALLSGAQICQFNHYRELLPGILLKESTSEGEAFYRLPERIDEVFLGVAIGRNEGFNISVWNKLYVAKSLRNALANAQEEFFFADDGLLNAYACTSADVQLFSVHTSAHYVYSRGGLTQKDSGYQYLKDARQYKSSILRMMDAFSMGEDLYTRVHSESIWCYRAIITGMIRNGYKRKEVLEAIEDVETFPHIIAAKNHFRLQREISEELIFMTGCYSAEDYYEFCASAIPKSRRVAKLVFFLSRVKGLLDRSGWIKYADK